MVGYLGYKTTFRLIGLHGRGGFSLFFLSAVPGNIAHFSPIGMSGKNSP